MTQDRKEHFIEIIHQKTGFPQEKIREGIKIDPFYPIGEKFEIGLAESVAKFAKYACLLDKMVENKAMDLDEIMEATDEKLQESGVTWEDIDVTKTFYDSLKNLYGESINDDHVMPLDVEDLEDGVMMVKMSRVIKNIRELALTPGEKMCDYIENDPSYLLFVDTTPWKEGYMCFYAEVGSEN